MREHFDFYGYNGPTDGKYYADDEVYTYGEDYRTVKRFKEYKDVGFNISLLQHHNAYVGEKWETSACKKCMDVAYKAGIDKVIVSDERLKDLCKEELLVGENGKFKSEEELLSFIDDCSKNYRNHPAFYGLQLHDEPIYKYLKEYGHVYKAIKKVIPNAELQCNLLNMCLPWGINKDEQAGDMYKDFPEYLNAFVDYSGIDYLMTDEYAFRRNNSISPWTMPTYQLLADVCKKRGVEMRLVMQSFTQEACVVSKKNPDQVEGSIAWRRMTEKDMYWQMNLAMGFGCKEYSFFTYFVKQHKHFNAKWAGSAGVDGGTFINLDGTRTRLYYYTKRIIAEMKEFEPVLIKYDFDNAYFFFPEGKKAADFEMTSKAILTDNKNIPISVKTERDPIIVTELKNGESRLYMVENIGNTFDELMYKIRPKKVEINLGELSNSAKVYHKGKLLNRDLSSGKLTEKLGMGQALFIEIER